MNIDKFCDRDWEELASSLSGEKGNRSELLDQFPGSDDSDTGKNWKALKTGKHFKTIRTKGKLMSTWHGRMLTPG